MSNLIVNDLVAGTTLTNSDAETVLKSHSFAANWFQLGVRHDFSSTVSIPDNNSTDTLIVRARFGGTTLTGTVLAVTAAIDIADGDVAVVSGWVTLTARGTAGTAKSGALTAGPDAAGVATGSGTRASVTSLDTTAIILLEITGEFSVAHADNQCAAEDLQISCTPG